MEDLCTAMQECQKDYEQAVGMLPKATRERLDEVGLLDMTFVSEVAAEGVEELAKIFTPHLGMVDDAANDWAAFFEVTEVARRSVAKRRCLHAHNPQHALAALSLRLRFDGAEMGVVARTCRGFGLRAEHSLGRGRHLQDAPLDAKGPFAERLRGAASSGSLAWAHFHHREVAEPEPPVAFDGVFGGLARALGICRHRRGALVQCHIGRGRGWCAEAWSRRGLARCRAATFCWSWRTCSGASRGGGMCSPGRWPPWRRRLQPRAEEVAELLNTILDEPVADYGKDFEVRLVSSLACARVEADPLRGLDDRVRVALEKLLAKSGFARDGRPNHPGAEVDFELIAALAKHLGDPDAKFPKKYRLGVRMGYRLRLPRTPAVYPRKSRWAAHVDTEVEIAEWAANYSSARHIGDKVNETFEEQERQGMMLPTTYREAKESYRDRLRIAAFGAVGPEGDERVVHDGTHQVGVNPGIRVRDQDEAPLHDDLAAILGTEEAYTPSGFCALAFDVGKAHRRVPIAVEDWGLQACCLGEVQEYIKDGDPVWLNTVGTNGIGSVSYHWNRFGALMVRILIGVVGPRGLRWVLRLVRSGAVSRPLLMAILLVRAVSIPLKWSKFRGGVRTEWVGHFMDFEAKELGVSDRRCDWAARWCRTQAQGKIEVASFREGSGRLAFAAGRPFLGPLHAWCAAVGGQRSADPPPLVVLVLEWLAEEFDEKRPSTKALG